jgi:hypothetical protein
MRWKSPSTPRASSRMARGLGQPRRALDQQVAVGEQRDQQAVDQVLLPDDLLRQPGAKAGDGVAACTHVVLFSEVRGSGRGPTNR